MCASSFIHIDCAFLPINLQIQHTTNDIFSHNHPLTLAYSNKTHYQISINFPRCRVCDRLIYELHHWIYKCEKCRYYTHLNCATSRSEPFMSIFKSSANKNYKDAEHPDLLHLPFPDPSYSILKHLFFKKNGSSTFQINDIVAKTHTDSHQHLLILEDSDFASTASSIKDSISYHDPMKKIELLCDGCLRPITTKPVYVCANEDEHCNFVLHEWCTRLPLKLEDHYHHQQHHTLVLHSKVSGRFFGVYTCDICQLPCNGFVYYCDECKYHIDVNCAFLPKEITHSFHPNHLLTRVCWKAPSPVPVCSMCDSFLASWKDAVSFCCNMCDFYLHPMCTLLIPETTMHKCDKHPMKLSYFPIENHMSEYFCEICEEELNPEYPFYHCVECIQSIHLACATSILQYETYAVGYKYCGSKDIHEFINVKFGGTYNNTKMHPHPLSFVQGIERDGQCIKCNKILHYRMIFKCLKCKFAVHFSCML